MRLEWLRQRAARDRMQNRRFDFEISAFVQKPPQFANDQASLHENIADFAIDDQIDVSLPVPNLDILQAVPFFRQRKKALREKHEFGRQYRQFAGPRAEQRSFDADEVADIEQLVQLEVAFRKLILLCVYLQLAFAVRQRDESGLSKRTIRENPARNTNLVLVVFQFFARSFRRTVSTTSASVWVYR